MIVAIVIVLTGVGVLFGVGLIHSAFDADRRDQLGALQAQVEGLRDSLERSNQQQHGAAVLIQIEALRRSLAESLQEVDGSGRDIRDRLDRVIGLLTTGREDW